MDRNQAFDHFYDQYKEQVSEADYLYRRAALWLSANGLVGTILAALATGSPGRRFGVDIAEPTAAVIGVLTGASLLGAFVLMGLALFPRRYGRFSLPHEIIAFREMYRGDLERAGYPPEHRRAVESEITFEELSKVLAEKTRLNAELNEMRHRLLGRSSMLTFVAVAGLMIMLSSAVVSAPRVQGRLSNDQQSGTERFEREASGSAPVFASPVGNSDAQRPGSQPAASATAIEPTAIRNNDEGRLTTISSWVGPLLQNVVGGILSAVAFAFLVWVFRRIWRWIRLRRFERFFGASIVESGLTIVCAELQLREDVLAAARSQNIQPSADFPFLKPGLTGYAVTTQRPVSLAEIRAVNYLAAEFRRWLPSSPRVLSDLDVRADLNLNFVSLGFGSNLKTRDALTNSANTAIDTDFSSRFEDRATKLPAFQRESGFDYGLILKLHPTQFPARAWFSCAGVNEWGTSGAAWLLANKWESALLRRRLEDGSELGDRCFAAWVKVRPGQDESTEVVRVVCL